MSRGDKARNLCNIAREYALQPYLPMPRSSLRVIEPLPKASSPGAGGVAPWQPEPGRGAWRDCLSMMRPFTLLPPVLAVLSGAACAWGSRWNPDPSRSVPQVLLVVLVAALCASILNGGSNMLNQIFDLEIDRINKPNRLLPSGRVSLHTVWQWSTMLYALALLPMWFIPSTPPTGIASAAQPAALPTLLQAHAVPVLYLLGALFTLVYSIPALGRTKRYAIRSNLTIAVPRGLLLPVAAWGLVGPLDVAEPWVLGAVFLCFLTGAVSTKDYADMEGDRKGGCRTLPVRYGVYRSVKMISPCLVLPWLVFAAGTWIHDPTDATGTHMLLSGHPRVLQALGFGLALWGLWTLRVIWRNPQALTTRENHPSWLHMYGMLMTAQVGLLVAYLAA